MWNNEDYTNYYQLHKGLIIIISGPSGSGKSELSRNYVEEFRDRNVLSISDTTRPKKVGEINGVHYNFITEDEYEKRKANGYYVESAGKYGNHYGTPKKFIEENLQAGKNVVLEIETQGAAKIRKQFDNTVSIFLLPSNSNILLKQIEDRKRESQEEIEKRLSETKQEIEQIKYYNFILINQYGKQKQTVMDLHRIILAEEHNVNFILDQYKNKKGENDG